MVVNEKNVCIASSTGAAGIERFFTVTRMIIIIVPLIAAVSASADPIYPIDYQESFTDYGEYGEGGICTSALAYQWVFKSEWPPVAQCRSGPCFSLKVDFEYDGAECPDGFRGWDQPFYVESGKDVASQNYKDLAPMIQALYPEFDAVNGSDENPLELKVYVNMKDNSQKWEATSFWIQLYAGDYNDMAPNDPEQLLIHNGCVLENVTAPTPRKSIAFGSFPNLLPCDACPGLTECQDPPNSDLLDTNVFYNGDHWIVLRENVPAQAPGSALAPVPGACWWTITIKTDTVDITVEPIGGTAVTRTGIPRIYTDPFQAIGLGSGAKTDYPAYIDAVSLTGGYLVTLGGACCLTDGSCIITAELDCTTNLGGTWNDVGSTCDESIICCPLLWADIDVDGDVDQADFGLWQRCFSGSTKPYPTKLGCECLDRNDFTGLQGGDGDIDADDLDWFANCFTGPEVALNIDDQPNCIP